MMNILNKYNIGKKKLIGIGIFLLLVIILPLILIQVQNQQQTKQLAVVQDSVHLELNSNQEQVIKVGEDFVVYLDIKNPSFKDISAVDVVVSYNTDLLELRDSSLSEGWELVYSRSIDKYGTRFVIVNSTSARHYASWINLIKLKLKLKTQGAGHISLENITITASGESQPLEITKKTPPFTFDSTVISPTPDLTSTPVPQAYYLEQSESTIYMPVSQPTTGYGLYVLLRESGTNNIVVNQQDFTYHWSLDNYSLASIDRHVPCKFDIPCSEGRLIIQGLKPGSGNIYVKMIQISTGLSVATATFSLNVLPPDITPTPDITITPTPLPFSSSVFPTKGIVGTLFKIDAKTDLYQRVQFSIWDDRGKLIELDVSDDGHGDGRPNDGNYSYIFNSIDRAPGYYLVTFAINGKKVGTAAFEIIDQKIAEASCIPITKNGDSSKKIDILVVPVNYKGSELDIFQKEILTKHVDYLFSKDPFSLNKDKFNIWFLDVDSDIDCSYENGRSCWNRIENNVVQTSCTFADKIIVLDKEGAGGYASGFGTKTAVTRGSSNQESVGVTMHEFGHSLGGLADEYDDSSRSSMTDLPNCDAFACPKWCSSKSDYVKPQCDRNFNQQSCSNDSYNGVKCIWSFNKCDYPYFSNINFGQSCQEDTVCYYGCGGRFGYRSSQFSIMGDPNLGKNREYNSVSKRQIQKMIDLFNKQ